MAGCTKQGGTRLIHLIFSAYVTHAWTHLPRRYWRVVAAGAVLTPAHFSEVFLVLRAQQGGLALALMLLFLVVMNLAYAIFAYPFGILADRMRHRSLLVAGILPLIAADLLLVHSA